MLVEMKLTVLAQEYTEVVQTLLDEVAGRECLVYKKVLA